MSNPWEGKTQALSSHSPRSAQGTSSKAELLRDGTVSILLLPGFSAPSSQHLWTTCHPAATFASQLLRHPGQKLPRIQLPTVIPPTSFLIGPTLLLLSSLSDKAVWGMQR